MTNKLLPVSTVMKMRSSILKHFLNVHPPNIVNI